MTSDFSLTSLALSVGQVHGAIVEAAIRGSLKKDNPPPSMERALAQLQDMVKLPQQDYDKLSRIVALATNKSERPVQETLLQIRRIDEDLRRKPEQAHPLTLAISSIASDSASTALSAPTPRSAGAVTPRPVTTGMSVVAADLLGAVLGGIAGAKAGKDIESTIVGAVGGAILASSAVGGGKPFPVIGVVVE
jgi:hypothetical protein